MAELLTNAKRKEAEELIYKFFDTLDKTHTNSDYYRELFKKMSNDEFYHFFERRLPLRFHYEPFKIEPKMEEIVDCFNKVLHKPLFERVNVPHFYVNHDGKPIKTEPVLVIYLYDKRMKQFVQHKSHIALNTEKRDMKTGLLSGEDKGGKETDREFEALAAYGLEYSIDEFARPRADSLRAAAEMNNVILTKGTVSDKDIHIDKSDSLGKNMVNVYLLGAHIHSNLVDTDYMTPYTAANRQSQVERL